MSEKGTNIPFSQTIIKFYSTIQHPEIPSPLNTRPQKWLTWWSPADRRHRCCCSGCWPWRGWRSWGGWKGLERSSVPAVVSRLRWGSLGAPGVLAPRCPSPPPPRWYQVDERASAAPPCHLFVGSRAKINLHRVVLPFSPFSPLFPCFPRGSSLFNPTEPRPSRAACSRPLSSFPTYARACIHVPFRVLGPRFGYAPTETSDVPLAAGMRMKSMLLDVTARRWLTAVDNDQQSSVFCHRFFVSSHFPPASATPFRSWNPTIPRPCGGQSTSLFSPRDSAFFLLALRLACRGWSINCETEVGSMGSF